MANSHVIFSECKLSAAERKMKMMGGEKMKPIGSLCAARMKYGRGIRWMAQHPADFRLDSIGQQMCSPDERVPPSEQVCGRD